MSKASPKKGLQILDERIERRAQASEEENPYWTLEEIPPHPAPEKGCLQRGYCCKSSPGWFAPGEAEAAAALLNMSPDDFVRQYLIIDSLELDGQRVEVFAPVKIGRDGAPLAPPASRVDELYRIFRSPCVFYDGKGCRIYQARPLECRRYLCTLPDEEQITHKEIAAMWRGE